MSCRSQNARMQKFHFPRILSQEVTWQYASARQRNKPRERHWRPGKSSFQQGHWGVSEWRLQSRCSQQATGSGHVIYTTVSFLGLEAASEDKTPNGTKCAFKRRHRAALQRAPLPAAHLSRTRTQPLIHLPPGGGRNCAPASCGGASRLVVLPRTTFLLCRLQCVSSQVPSSRQTTEEKKNSKVAACLE